jgi:transcriptional regulator with XRE-family HTH domain
MGVIAASAYIRTLREARHLSRAKLAAIAGTHESQIERIEKEGQDTRGSLLVAIVRALRGNLNQVGQLMLDVSATAEDGKRLAQEWLVQKGNDRSISCSPDVQLAEIMALIRQLQVNPVALGHLSRYLDRLTNEYKERT